VARHDAKLKLKLERWQRAPLRSVPQLVVVAAKYGHLRDVRIPAG